MTLPLYILPQIICVICHSKALTSSLHPRKYPLIEVYFHNLPCWHLEHTYFLLLHCYTTYAPVPNQVSMTDTSFECYHQREIFTGSFFFNCINYIMYVRLSFQMLYIMCYVWKLHFLKIWKILLVDMKSQYLNHPFYISIKVVFKIVNMH